VDIPADYRLIELEEIDSTNSECLRLARQGDPGRLWVAARRQAAGRGSRGRAWESAPGNLFCSLLLLDAGPVRWLATLTFVAALAVREAIAEAAAARGLDHAIALKWPNDVLIAGRKAAGILLEHHKVGAADAVIVGIGLNCTSHPAGTLHPATDLAAEGLRADRVEMLERIAGQFPALLSAWRRGEGFDAIRRAWLMHAAGIGARADVAVGGRNLSGTVEGLDGQGYLELRLPDGRTERLSAADVFLREQG